MDAKGVWRVVVWFQRRPRVASFPKLKGVTAMNVQIFNKPFIESFWLQTAALVILTAVLIAVAAKYVW
jgi:hypothetical protein